LNCRRKITDVYAIMAFTKLAWLKHDVETFRRNLELEFSTWLKKRKRIARQRDKLETR
jgi:hypothetical protein